jgi:hypothetical protein
MEEHRPEIAWPKPSDRIFRTLKRHASSPSCRWLLMMHDRAEGEALPYTHEFLSHILGANRKSVTLAAQAMQLAVSSATVGK